MADRGEVDFVMRWRAAEFDQWKALFHEQLDIRLKHGATGHRILQVVGDPHDIEVVISFASLGGAEGYAGEVSRFALQRRAEVEGGGHHRVNWDETIRQTIDSASYD